MGKLITDAAIQKALREVKTGKKTEARLTDPAPRGAGRLMAKIRPDLVEWYAMRTVAGRRKLEKLGRWPAMSITAARDAFGEPPADAPAAPAPGATFRDLVDGYIASLAAAGKQTKMPTAMLGQAAAIIGAKRPAGDVTPADIVRVVKPIYDRDAPVMADKMRMWLVAAFRWGMQAEHDYRVKKTRKWGIASNPAAAVPRDKSSDRVGERWLNAKELVNLLHWAMEGESSGRRAIALLALTGQRVHEIIDMRAENWNSRDRLLHWAKTKNGKPHTIPVCKQAATILDSIKPGPGGHLFPGDTGKPIRDAAVLAALVKYARKWKMQPFTGRDLRRTWKTLAGEAGLTKVERDLLQNHTEGDVSSRHYDRWNSMPEKRAAIAKWEAWLSQQLRQRNAKADAGQVVDQ